MKVTIQMKDRLFLSGQKYDILVGIVDGRFEMIFNILDLDLNFESSFNSACYQGYNGDYNINEGKLKLKEIQINLDDTDILINGVKAIKQKTIMEYYANKYANGVDVSRNGVETDDLSNLSFFNCRFENINIDINFTGDIILGYGVGENKEFYLKDGLEAWINMYEKLMKLTIKEGKVILFEELNSEDVDKIKKEELRIHKEAIKLLREEDQGIQLQQNTLGYV